MASKENGSVLNCLILLSFCPWKTMNQSGENFCQSSSGSLSFAKNLMKKSSDSTVFAF